MWSLGMLRLSTKGEGLLLETKCGCLAAPAAVRGSDGLGLVFMMDPCELGDNRTHLCPLWLSRKQLWWRREEESWLKDSDDSTRGFAGVVALSVSSKMFFEQVPPMISESLAGTFCMQGCLLR